MMRERVQLAQQLEGYVGKYFSNKYIRTKILKQNEQEQEMMDEEITNESETNRINDEMKQNRERLKSITGGDTDLAEPEQEQDKEE